jgi:hypothetical protein
MDVVVEAHLTMSQQKNIERRAPNIAAATRVQRQQPVTLTASTPPIDASNWTVMACQFPLDTTRRTAALERNDPVEANSFAVETDNFSSSPLMVQLIFFERSH